MTKLDSSHTTLEGLAPGFYLYDNKPAFLDSSFSSYGTIVIRGNPTGGDIGTIATLTEPGVSGGVWQNIRYTGQSTYRGWKRLDNFGCNTAADLASLLKPYL